MNHIKIDHWTLSQWNADTLTQPPVKATVPGCIHYDLCACGRLENPYRSTKAARDAAWVARTDWSYQGEFHLVSGDQEADHLSIYVGGIDTYADILVNGQWVGSVKNAYRSYEFPIPQTYLHTGSNHVTVEIKAFDHMIKSQQEAARCLNRGEEPEGMLGKSLIRRYQRSFFTSSSLLNLGTGVLGMGIIRPMEIRRYENVHIEDCCYQTVEAGKQEACGYVELSLDREAILDAEVSIREEGGVEVFCARQKFTGGREMKLPVVIPHPHLWWPVGYGIPYLYQMEISIWDGDHKVDCVTRPVGIRTVKLVTRVPGGRASFFFQINGKDIWIHGQNVIPMDYLKSYGDEKQYRNLFRLLINGNVNLVRIWGGGMIESQDFYDQCDRMGILIWQEFFLHSNVYPDYDPEFVEEFLKETEGILRQVRNHPSLCLLCGGNEQQEGWDEWGWKQELRECYGISLPKKEAVPLVEHLCPTVPYIYNSPHGGKWGQSPVEGECHNWGNYYNSTKDPLFVTETCWTTESYSRPETLKKYMDLDPSELSGLGWADKWKEITSLPLFNRMPYSNWFDHSSLTSYLFGLELEQARADYHAVSQFRLKSPSCRGIIYWPFNKGGPLFQFGCVDYGGYPLMSYYVMKRLYAPVAVYAYRDLDDIRIVLSNHSSKEQRFNVQVIHYRNTGEIRRIWSFDLDAASGSSCLAGQLSGYYKEIHDRTGELLFIKAIPVSAIPNEEVNGEAEKAEHVTAEDLMFFCPYSEYENSTGEVSAVIRKESDVSCILELQSEGIRQMVLIEANQPVMCSDNYFPMIPGERKCVRMELLEGDLEEPLQVTVRDLYGKEVKWHSV